MGAVVAGIKLVIANIILSLIAFVLQMIAVVVLQSEAAQSTIDQLSNDPAAVSSLSVPILAALVGLIIFLIVLQGYVVNRLWGWD